MKQYYLLRYLDPNPGGNGGGGAITESEQLLQKIRTDVTGELEKRGYLNKTAVETMLQERMAGLDLEALRAYDKQDLEQRFRNLATQVDAIVAGAQQPASSDPAANIRAFINAKVGEAEKIYNTRGKNTAGVPMSMEFKLSNRAAAIMTTDNTITGTVPDDLIDSVTIAEFVEKRYGVEYIFELVSRTTVADMEQYSYWEEEGSEQGAFAIVAEGALKPLVSYDLVRNYAEAQKVAGKYVVTEEFVKFKKRAYAIIQRLLRKKMARDYAAIVTTMVQAEAVGYAGTTLDGTFESPNDYDAIGAVAAQLESLEYTPDVLVLNPQDKWRLRLAKATDNNYLFPVTTQDGVVRIFELRVITSTKQTAGTFTVAEAGLFELEEEPVSVRMGYGIEVTTAAGNVTAVTSDFDTNRFRVILETFVKGWLSTPYTGSIVTATFDTVKAALQAA